MPDSGKFKDLYLDSAHTYPCQGPIPPTNSGWMLPAVNRRCCRRIPVTAGLPQHGRLPAIRTILLCS